MDIFTITATNGDSVRLYSFYCNSRTAAVHIANQMTADNIRCTHRDAYAWRGSVVLTNQSNTIVKTIR